MDMKIAGSGQCGPGEYDHVKISGSGKLEGPIRCKSMHCSGSARCHGAIEASEEIRVSGSAHFEGDLKSGSLSVSGSAKIDGNGIVQAEMKIAGGFRCTGNIRANRLLLSGSIRANNMEAEEVSLAGTVVCPGLLNAEKIEIEIDGTGSELGSIGGSHIEIGRKQYHANLGFLFFGSKEARRGSLTVKDSIEGDELVLDHVRADKVVGRIVEIGPGCHIRQVQYSEHIKLDPRAEVGEQIKI